MIWIHRIRTFLRNQGLNPYETYIAAMCMCFSGWYALSLGFDLVDKLIGRTVQTLWIILFVTASVCWFLGIGLSGKRLQFFGVAAVGSSAAVRCVWLGWTMWTYGPNLWRKTFFILSAGLLIACIARIRTILAPQTILVVEARQGAMKE